MKRPMIALVGAVLVPALGTFAQSVAPQPDPAPQIVAPPVVNPPPVPADARPVAAAPTGAGSALCLAHPRRAGLDQQGNSAGSDD